MEKILDSKVSAFIPKSVLWSSSWPRSVYSVHPKLNNKVIEGRVCKYGLMGDLLVSPPQHWDGWGLGELPPELLLWPHWLIWILAENFRSFSFMSTENLLTIWLTHLSYLLSSDEDKLVWFWIMKGFILRHWRPWYRERQPYNLPLCSYMSVELVVSVYGK